MAEAGDTGPGQGLVLVDSLSLRWCTADPAMLAADALRYHDNNDEVLRVIAALEETPELGEEHHPAAVEIARLEVKLNLLLGLMGQLLSVHFPLPPRRPVRLNPLGIEWVAESGPQPGETGTIEIWISPLCPKPLIMAGRVADVVVDAEQCRRYEVQFTRMAEPVRDRLEKIIFRHHRRRVALTRRRAQTQE